MILRSAALQAAVEYGLTTTTATGFGRVWRSAGRTAEDAFAWMGDHSEVLIAGAVLLAFLVVRRSVAR